ncbi:hypothetical protein ACJMK2_014411 [Sinanodonta woodiana]|uniref:Uncharacterized protein n=1 Tax=Sinanodonta woodiana TaxID=1069815 RepID=A0ABD3V1U4_SINWO
MEKCFVGEEAGPSNRRVEMFHANTDKEYGNIEVLDSTEAFGMSVNIPNIDLVIHRGYFRLHAIVTGKRWDDVLMMAEGGIQEPLMSLLS